MAVDPSLDRAQTHGEHVVGSVIATDVQPNTDGPTNRTVEALVGGTPQRVGRFEYHYAIDRWTWSDTVARMHGYEPDEVEPTTDLVLSHKHPDDLAHVRDLLQQSASPFSSRHRIRTTTGDERKVVVVGDAVTDPDGCVVATQGFYIDITDDMNAEIQRSLTDELQVILGHRAVIDQAKGMLMAVYALGADAAFGVLRWRSQECNVKLSVLAERLVADLPNLLNSQSEMRAPVDHYLMTLGMSDAHPD
jgi:PAS domain S-box-containing protein